MKTLTLRIDSALPDGAAMVEDPIGAYVHLSDFEKREAIISHLRRTIDDLDEKLKSAEKTILAKHWKAVTQKEENAKFRRMLACCYTAPDFVNDDLIDRRAIPHIDFRLDSADAVQRKMYERLEP